MNFHIEFAFYCGKVSLWALVATADIHCPNWTSKAPKKMTTEFCQDRVGQSFKSFLFHKKSLPDVLDPQVEDECPNVAEETWVTVQAASCFCHFYSFRSCLLCISCLLR